MKIITTLQTFSIAAVLIASGTLVNAASHAAAPATSAAKQDLAKSNLPMATAEIRKIDLENKKITLKHGEIKNLDMPGMTMVFAVKDAVMLDKLAAGDKVMFTADKVGSTFTVMSIEKAK
jgi:Cu(I)/Ag(I) efflux system periplasmic protein CusF